MLKSALSHTWMGLWHMSEKERARWKKKPFGRALSAWADWMTGDKIEAERHRRAAADRIESIMDQQIETDRRILELLEEIAAASRVFIREHDKAGD